MFNIKSLLICLVVLFCGLSARAEKHQAELSPAYSKRTSGTSAPVKPSEQLVSPSVARRFYDIAGDIADSEDVSASEIEQAIVFLKAARQLDRAADYVLALLIKLACKATIGDHSELIYYSLQDYVDESADLGVTGEAIGFLLDQLNSREEREILLKDQLKTLGDKNTIIRSELSALLGMLMAEKPDVEGAKFYLTQAYINNKYNRVAFAELIKLLPEQMGPAMRLEHRRLMVREDPSNIDVVLAFAEYAESLGLYEAAAKAYEYGVDLFHYLYPSEPLPARIYIPWAISYYNTPRGQHKCLQIASQLRQQGQFDLLLEAIAGKAAMKIGNTQQATQIFQAAEAKAQQLLKQGPRGGTGSSWVLEDGSSRGVGAKQFAWFYGFVQPDKHKALDWANKAYSTDPNSPTAAALLAYSLLMNQQVEWAKPLLENYQHNQIADLTLALIQLNQGKRDSAIRTLNSAIAKDPGSLVAEQAKELLTGQGQRYIPPVDPNAVLGTLEKDFGSTFIPRFVPPEEIISVELNMGGNKFSYGSNIEGHIAITNNSSEPLVISDDGLFKGNIRVDADVSGDLKKHIPKVISTKIRTALVVEPGQSILKPVQLVTGELRQTLLAHPQASLDIEFTLYIDPVVTSEGKITNRLTHIEPTKVLVKRPGVELTSEYLRNRFNSVVRGQVGQRIKTARLFIGLLMEQQEMKRGKPLYRYMYADWMPTMLRSALIHESGLLRNPSGAEWPVKVHTMADMLALSMDQQIVRAVSENLRNPKWPVRLMALYLLAKTPGSRFDRVLDWVAKYDSDKLVCNMAEALSSIEPGGPKPSKLPEPNEPLQPQPIQQK